MSVMKKNVIAKATVSERNAISEAWLTSMKNHNAAEIGVICTVNVVFSNGKRYKRELAIPLTETKPISRGLKG